MSPALVICRDSAGLKWLTPNALGLDVPLVVASDDLRVHAAAKRMERVHDIVFLEKIESFYPVVPDVLLILDAVNEWLSSLGRTDEVPKELLYWICHCEGGDTTQRIQDALLLVRSYQFLIERFRPTLIVIIRSPSTSWEDDLLVACSGAAGVKTRVIGELGWRGWARSIWSRWRPLAKEVYFSLSIISAWMRNVLRPRSLFDREKSVMVQLCDSAQKHFVQCQPLLAALDNVGLHGVALCWGAGGSAAILRRDGRRVVELESWVSLGTLAASWVRTFMAWRRARTRLSEFLKEETGCTHVRLVREVLSKSVRSFFLGEVAHRYRLDAACRRFFAANLPRAARFWTRVLPQGVIAYRALPLNHRPLIFWHVGHNVPWPYEHYDVPADLTFVTGEAERNSWLTRGVPTDQVNIAGNAWSIGIHEFRKSFTKSDSRRILGVNAQVELCVLLDPSAVHRGVTAPAEQAQWLTALLDLAQDHSDLHLIIKPHQVHRPGALEVLVSQYSIPNLTLVPTRDLPYHALNAADILVTKISTLAIQGMFLDVPTIAVLLDGENRFACFENAAEYVYNIPDLQARVVDLLRDRAVRAEWCNNRRVGATEYLRRHSSTNDPYEIIATTISRRLQCSS